MDTSPPGPEAKALAEKELRETDENVKKGIENLRKLLEGKLKSFYDFLWICYF